MKNAFVYGSLILSLASGCSTIRMNYDAKIQTEENKKGKFHYENSYDVGAYPVLCALTGLFLGGACWFYLVMPTTGQRNLVTRDAEEKLEEILSGKKYEVLSSRTDKQSWIDVEEKTDWQPTQ